MKTKVGNIKRDWGQYMVKFLLSFFILIQKVKVKVAQRCPWNSPGQNTGVSSLSLLHGVFPTQGSNPSLPYWRQILYQLEPTGKPKNTGVDSLPLLQGIFLTQELNQGLLHCRQILSQLSYKGCPYVLWLFWNSVLPLPPSFALNEYYFVHYFKPFNKF